jgi:hypothetical protein
VFRLLLPSLLCASHSLAVAIPAAVPHTHCSLIDAEDVADLLRPLDVAAVRNGIVRDSPKKKKGRGGGAKPAPIRLYKAFDHPPLETEEQRQEREDRRVPVALRSHAVPPQDSEFDLTPFLRTSTASATWAAHK